jgi:hypothetical protein
MSNVELVDLTKKVGLAVNLEYHLLYLPTSEKTLGHWSSSKGWVKQVTLHGNTVDNDKIKELRTLLLINDVPCHVTKKITVMKDFQ